MRSATVLPGEPATTGELVRFDRKTWIFLAALLLWLALGTASKVHGSSIGIWNLILREQAPEAGVLQGTPKGVRQDEWLLTTPAILSQALQEPSFPLLNPVWGPQEVPLVFNLPARHWSMLVRPQFWGFFAFDVERAYAFYWNMKAFLLLAGSFLLLMLLTRNAFGVSLFGSAWIFFSGYMQWWYSSPHLWPDMVGCTALVLVAVHYLSLSDRRWVIASSALVALVGALAAGFCFYPPHQVMLFYLSVAILAGSLGPRLARGAGKKHLGFRIASAVAALAALAALLWLYYQDARAAIELMRGTVYPGSRMVSGGEVSLAHVFGGFYGFFMSEQRFPDAWQNICESSNFVLLFPVPMAALLWRAWRRLPVTALEWGLMAYLVIVLVWMTIGFPRGVAVATGFGVAAHVRPLLGLGLSSILLCCIFLARAREDRAGGRARWTIALAWLAAVFLLGLDFNRTTQGFATSAQLALVVAGAGVAGYLLLAGRRLALAACVLAPLAWCHALVNPVARGLGPVLDAKVLASVSELVARDPKARWTVYGSHLLADLLKVAGANVFNGMKFVPPLEDLRTIDATPQAAEFYNRYAHISLAAQLGSQVSFALDYQDSYTIKIDPKSDRWRELGIRYVALPFAATDREFLAKATFERMLPSVGVWIYKYTW